MMSPQVRTNPLSDLQNAERALNFLADDLLIHENSTVFFTQISSKSLAVMITSSFGLDIAYSTFRCQSWTRIASNHMSDQCARPVGRRM